MKFLLNAALLLLLLGTTHISLASPHRHHHHRHGAGKTEETALDLTPVVVQPYVLPNGTGDPVRVSFLRRMNLENGVRVHSTRWIRPQDVTTRDLFILDVTQSLEGGFDSVNVYDKGVLSWGILQWTAGTGDLPGVLLYIKRRLLATGQSLLWQKAFVAQGLDVTPHGLAAFGKPLLTPTDMRLAFRGSQIVGNYDPKVASYWATVLARAGRQPSVQRFQDEYAGQVVDEVLTQPLPGVPYHASGRAATLGELAGHDPYSEALAFALWTNNPRHSREYVADAARAARAESASDDPARWGPETFRNALFQRCGVSRFGNWKQRAASVAARASALGTADPAALTPFERNCRIALAARQAHLIQLASRHKPVRQKH